MTERGPDGRCWAGACHERHYGALPPLPEGYSVWWHGEHEHYSAHGPGWESCITVDPYQARRWALERARGRGAVGGPWSRLQRRWARPVIMAADGADEAT